MTGEENESFHFFFLLLYTVYIFFYAFSSQNTDISVACQADIGTKAKSIRHFSCHGLYIFDSLDSHSFLSYLFEQIQNCFQFLPLSLVSAFLSQVDLSRDEGIVDNVEDVRIVRLKE